LNAPSATAPLVFRASPSSVEVFLSCPARWGFAKLPGGTQEPGSDATEFGTSVHSERERYLEAALAAPNGVGYDFPNTREGVVARALSKHLPRGMPPYGLFEEDLEYEPEPGVVLHGLPDMAWPDTHNRVAIVADYKTCGTFRYAKLERDALFGHAQAPLYLLFAMRRWGYDKARSLWLYAERPPPVMPPTGWPEVRVETSKHEISREDATERVHLRMLPAARQMREYYTSGMTAADAVNMPKNLRACRAFNRLCPHYQTCKPKKEQDMSEANAFLAGLGMSATAPTAPATPPAASNAAVAGTPPVIATPPGDKSSETDKPKINPPEADEGKGKGKGKGNKADAPRFTPEELDALCDNLIDRLALRLVRNVK
jgi:hypothetical protein